MNIRYCTKQIVNGQREFFHIYEDPRGVKMCGYEDHEIVKISIREALPEEPENCWGWFDLERQKITLIYPKKVLLEMCFPYGPEAEQTRGHMIRLVAQEI